MSQPAGWKRKNLLLLAVIVSMVVAQPVAGHRSIEAGTFFHVVFGAICLYVLRVVLATPRQRRVGLALVPGAFGIKPEIAWRLARWHLRHALFDYLSFTALTGLGYGDISPAGPPVYSLMWLEVIFGQFYMAVVVAQLVGLKLALAMKTAGPPPS
jgi:hypothetical protein